MASVAQPQLDSVKEAAEESKEVSKVPEAAVNRSGVAEGSDALKAAEATPNSESNVSVSVSASASETEVFVDAEDEEEGEKEKEASKKEQAEGGTEKEVQETKETLKEDADETKEETKQEEAKGMSEEKKDQEAAISLDDAHSPPPAYAPPPLPPRRSEPVKEKEEKEVKGANVDGVETREGEEEGMYVGDATWEERTWKELTRLREEMFWARIGAVRS